MLSNLSNKPQNQAANISKHGKSENISNLKNSDSTTPRNESYVSSMAKKAYDSLTGNDMDEEDEISDENLQPSQVRLRDSMKPQKDHGNAYNSNLEEEANPDYIDDGFNPKRNLEASNYSRNADVAVVDERGDTTEIRKPEKDEKFANYTYSSMVDPYITEKDVNKSNQNMKHIERKKSNKSTSDDSTGFKKISNIFKRRGSSKESDSKFDPQKQTDVSEQSNAHHGDNLDTAGQKRNAGTSITDSRNLHSKGFNINDTSRVSEFANPGADPGTYLGNMKSPYEMKGMSKDTATGTTGTTGLSAMDSDKYDNIKNRKASTGSVGSYKSLPGTHGLVPGTSMTVEEAEQEDRFYKHISHEDPEGCRKYHIPGTMNAGIDTVHRASKDETNDNSVQYKEMYDNEIRVNDKHTDQPLGPFLTQLEDEPHKHAMDHIENKDFINTEGVDEHGNLKTTYMDETEESKPGTYTSATGEDENVGIVGGMLGYLGLKGTEGRGMDTHNLPGALPMASEYDNKQFGSSGMDTKGEGLGGLQDDRLGNTMGYVKDRNITSVNPTSGQLESNSERLGFTKTESAPYRYVQEAPEDLTLTQKDAKKLTTDKSSENYDQTTKQPLLDNTLAGANIDTALYRKIHSGEMDPLLTTSDAGLKNDKISGEYTEKFETTSPKTYIDSPGYGSSANKGFSTAGTDDHHKVYDLETTAKRKPLPSQDQAFAQSTNDDSELLSRFDAAKGNKNNMKGHENQHSSNNGPMDKLKHMFKKDPVKQQEQYEKESAMNDPRHRSEAIGAASAAGIIGASDIGGSKSKDQTFGGIPTSPNAHKYTYSSKAAADMESPFVASKLDSRAEELKQQGDFNQATPSDDIPISSKYNNDIGTQFDERKGFEKNRSTLRKNSTSDPNICDTNWVDDVSYKNSNTGDEPLKVVQNAAEIQRPSSAVTAPVVGKGVSSSEAGAGTGVTDNSKLQFSTGADMNTQDESESQMDPTKLFSASGQPVKYDESDFKLKQGTFGNEGFKDEMEMPGMIDKTKLSNTRQTVTKDDYDNKTKELHKGSKIGDNTVTGYDDNHHDAKNTASKTPHHKKGLKEFFGGSKDTTKEPIEKSEINDRGTVYTETHEDMANINSPSEQPKLYKQQPTVKADDLSNDLTAQNLESGAVVKEGDMIDMHPNDEFNENTNGRRKSFLSRMKDKMTH